MLKHKQKVLELILKVLKLDLFGCKQPFLKIGVDSNGESLKLTRRAAASPLAAVGFGRLAAFAL